MKSALAVLLWVVAGLAWAEDPEPAVQTSSVESAAPSAAPAGVAAAPAPAPAAMRAAGGGAAPAPSGAHSAAKAMGSRPAGTGKAGAVQDRIELDATQITGNRELPNVMYVVPWKRPDLGDFAGRPPKSLLDELLAPVDREVFQRQNRYFAALQPDGAGGAGGAGGASGSNAAAKPAPASGAAADTPAAPASGDEK